MIVHSITAQDNARSGALDLPAELEGCLLENHVARLVAADPSRWKTLKEGLDQIRDNGRVENEDIHVAYERALRHAYREICDYAKVIYCTISSCYPSHDFFARYGKAEGFHCICRAR